MKLKRITKPLRSVQVRVMLTGDLNSPSNATRVLRAHPRRPRGHQGAHPRVYSRLLDADREFQSWSRSVQTIRCVVTPSTNGITKAQP